jgi:hypothetical protein
MGKYPVKQLRICLQSIEEEVARLRGGAASTNETGV